MDILPREVTDPSVARAKQAGLLHRRMVAGGLAVQAIARSEPGIFRDLQMRCAACEYADLCEKDLRDSSVAPGWKDCCPNVVLLNALSELWWFRAFI